MEDSEQMKPTALTRKMPLRAKPKKLHLAVRSTLKSKGPKMTPIRRAARGQDCTIELPGICNHNPETVVLCHSNQLKDGKGMGLKAPDERACFGCSACHDVLDGRRPRPAWMTYEMLLGAFERAVMRTHEKLKQMGILK